MLSFGGIMMALYRREKTGRGDYLDMAMHDSILAWTPNVLGDVFANRRAPIVKHERTFGGSAFYNIYRTRDGKHVVLGAQEIKFVRNLLGELGRLDFVPLAERGPGPHQQPLIDFLRATFATRTQAEWLEWFRGKDVSFAPVNDLRQAFDDPHVQARGMRLVDEHGQEHIGVPIKFRDEPGQPRFTLPRLGEHNDEVLRAAGYSDADIAAMRAAGAFGGTATGH
jgi:crotonobetainyl-CoA:carnitine CoA-transferase CaiB-like acyl-CoA transferase